MRTGSVLRGLCVSTQGLWPRLRAVAAVQHQRGDRAMRHTPASEQTAALMMANACHDSVWIRAALQRQYEHGYAAGTLRNIGTTNCHMLARSTAEGWHKIFTSR